MRKFKHTKQIDKLICPNCGSELYVNIDEGGINDTYYFEYSCENCKTIWRDLYRYSETVYSTKEEQEE